MYLPFVFPVLGVQNHQCLVTVAFLVVVLTVQTWSKPMMEQQSAMGGSDDPENPKASLDQWNISAWVDYATDTPPKDDKICFRRRIVGLLLKLAILRATAIGLIDQPTEATNTGGSTVAPNPSLDITDEEMAEICKILCRYSML